MAPLPDIMACCMPSGCWGKPWWPHGAPMLTRATWEEKPAQLAGFRRNLRAFPKRSGAKSEPRHQVLRGPQLAGGGGHTKRCNEMEEGRVKLWMLVTIFCTVVPTIKVFSFLFALGNATESDEECGKRVWVRCAESGDETCEQGKNKALWLWRILFLTFHLSNPLLLCCTRNLGCV